jgi:acetyl-CoA C-acetyltransferase
LGNGKILDSIIQDGLWCAFDDQHMGCTGEVCQRAFHVSRAEQDEYASNFASQSSRGDQSGKFKDEIVPVEIPQKKGAPIIFDTDEPCAKTLRLKASAKLKPAFKEGGTVTPETPGRE